ncbi:hypothetical protein ZWY2020_057365 [Hordeum vulgare]|nr:hypothetical protein ZWY2020_057365 [Hordeum vulgare]
MAPAVAQKVEGVGGTFVGRSLPRRHGRIDRDHGAAAAGNCGASSRRCRHRCQLFLDPRLPACSRSSRPAAASRHSPTASLYLSYPPARPRHRSRQALTAGLRQEDDHGRPHRARSGLPARGASSMASFNRDSANAFQPHVSESLADAIKRAGFLHGRVDTETKEVMVDFIYESPQQGPDAWSVMRTPTRRSA